MTRAQKRRRTRKRWKRQGFLRLMVHEARILDAEQRLGADHPYHIWAPAWSPPASRVNVRPKVARLLAARAKLCMGCGLSWTAERQGAPCPRPVEYFRAAAATTALRKALRQ